MPPQYPPLPFELLPGVAASLILKRRRDFRKDALYCTRRLSVHITGQEHIPRHGPALLVSNHYSRAGFQAYWIALAISAAVPVSLHWTMTAAWTDDGTPGAGLRAAFSRVFFPRLARLYGFTSMPPMPPRPEEAAARASAVRRLLRAAHADPPPVLALVPEGQDTPGGALMRLHPGAGRLLDQLAKLGYAFIPVGVFEDETALCLRFGPTFHLRLPPGLSSAERDRQAADRVMTALAEQLPEELRGVYGKYDPPLTPP
jgi:hypothetical protein